MTDTPPFVLYWTPCSDARGTTNKVLHGRQSTEQTHGNHSREQSIIVVLTITVALKRACSSAICDAPL